MSQVHSGNKGIGPSTIRKAINRFGLPASFFYEPEIDVHALLSAIDVDEPDAPGEARPPRSPSEAIAQSIGLGQRLHASRLRSRMSEAELAKRAAIHETEVKAIEAGKHRPSIDVAIMLAEVLRIELSWLITGVGGRISLVDDPPALGEFLDSDNAQDITAEELKQLRGIRVPNPTADTYRHLLKAIRSSAEGG